MRLKLLLEEFKKERVTFYELSPRRVESDGLEYIDDKVDDEVRFISNSKTKKVYVFEKNILHHIASNILDIPYSFKVEERDLNYLFGVGTIRNNKIINIVDYELVDYINMTDKLSGKELEEHIKKLKEIKDQIDKHPSFLDLSRIKKFLNDAID